MEEEKESNKMVEGGATAHLIGLARATREHIGRFVRSARQLSTGQADAAFADGNPALLMFVRARVSATEGVRQAGVA